MLPYNNNTVYNILCSLCTITVTGLLSKTLSQSKNFTFLFHITKNNAVKFEHSFCPGIWHPVSKEIWIDLLRWSCNTNNEDLNSVPYFSKECDLLKKLPMTRKGFNKSLWSVCTTENLTHQSLLMFKVKYAFWFFWLKQILYLLLTLWSSFVLKLLNNLYS